MNKFDFKNRTAVITGGGQGFGLDIAKRFLESGAKVVICDINKRFLKSFSSSNPQIDNYHADISNESDMKFFFNEFNINFF